MIAGPAFNPHSASWFQWKTEFEARIAAARDSIERPGLDSTTTEGLRGEITALRALLELGAPASIDAGHEAPADYGLTRR